MPTSRSTRALSEPTGRERIPEPTFEYFRVRNRMAAFTMLNGVFEHSGLTKAELKDRLGCDAPSVSRLLGAPGNLTLDTISDALFAMSGATQKHDVERPLRAQKKLQPYIVPASTEKTIIVQIPATDHQLVLYGEPVAPLFLIPASYERAA